MADAGKGAAVAVMAEGMANAMGVGWTLMSSGEVRSAREGIAVSVVHRLGDGLWGATAVGM